MNDGEKVVIRTATNENIAQIFIEVILLSFLRISMINSKLNFYNRLEFFDMRKNKGISVDFVYFLLINAKLSSRKNIVQVTKQNLLANLNLCNKEWILVITTYITI